MKRLPIPFKPEWNATFQNYASKWVRKHYWRVRHILPTPEDAMQECALTFAKCGARYDGKVDNQKWFMALYKQALFRDWITLAAHDGNQPAVYYESDITMACSGLRERQSGPLLAALSGASDELKSVLSMLANAPAETLQALLPGDGEEPDPAGLSTWLCRAAGLKPKDIMAELQEITR